MPTSTVDIETVAPPIPEPVPEPRRPKPSDILLKYGPRHRQIIGMYQDDANGFCAMGLIRHYSLEAANQVRMAFDPFDPRGRMRFRIMHMNDHQKISFEGIARFLQEYDL